MPGIFITYRREDSAGYAGRLHEELEGRLGGDQVFRDADTLRAGQDFVEAIHRRLEQCQACLVLIGPTWATSQTAAGQSRLHQPGDYVCMEIAAALARPDVLVIPVLVGGARMPAAADLPDEIQPLARRHAMSVRDETWEADMDRLAGALRPGPAAAAAPGPAGTARPDPGGHRAPAPYVVAAAAAVLLVVGAGLWWRGGRDQDHAPQAGRTSANGSVPVKTVNTSPDGSTFAIDTPGTGSEVLLGNLIYVVVSGSVQRRGDGQRVWLRIRGSNEGYYPANFWDDSFRLVVDGQSIAPNGGLNELLGQRSIRQGVVRFDVPSLHTSATLLVTGQGRSGEIALDLSGNGAPPKHDEPDERDSLSHAAFSTISKDETPLLASGDVSTAVTRIGRRVFVNTQRITVIVKWSNEGRYPASAGSLLLRLKVGGEQLAPVESPSDAIAAASTFTGDVVFEIPPAAKTATLVASLGDAKSERQLTLHP